MTPPFAVRLATRFPNTGDVFGGTTYAMLDGGPITIRALIQHKIASELRKLRANKHAPTALTRLLGPDAPTLDLERPAHESVMIAIAYNELGDGYYVAVDGAPYTDLDAIVSLSPRTQVAFIVTPPMPASIRE